MKQIVLVDFGNIAARMLHTAIFLSKPKKKNGQFCTDEYANMGMHLILNTLRLLKKQYKTAEVVICLDGFGSWRKEFYPDYKANRIKSDKDEVNWEEWFAVVQIVIDNLQAHFPYKIIGYKMAEADDSIGIITREYHKSAEIVILSPDKDFIGLLKYSNVKIFDPMKKVWVQKNEAEIDRWEDYHALLGDAVDNIPNIKSRTKFTDKFLAYLKTKEIYTESVLEFHKLTISDKLIEDYNVFKKITAGKLKGQLSEIKDIYKSVPFGEKGVIKFMENLNENLQEDELWKIHFERNKVLTSLDLIPQHIYDGVLEVYKTEKIEYNPNKINEFLMNYSLMTLMKDVTDFYDNSTPSASSLDDFF